MEKTKMEVVGGYYDKKGRTLARTELAGVLADS